MDETLLKRPLKQGTQYNKYFGTQCESSFLGNGNTDLSISIMAKWVNKYKHQCKALALNEFTNLSIENTCNAIYTFLYNHIQYKLDGTDQKIRSPYCSWQDRQNGIDCKSYSVFASCILSNLGIVHYLRKVKQPGYNPDSFSHVYVVIPKNQKTKKLTDGYYIIDATIHDNYELPFIEKKDKLMSNVGLPHYGLGKPTTTVLGCGCNSTALAAPISILPQAVECFKKFLLKLEQQGVSRSQTQAALSRLEAALTQGKNPKLSTLFKAQNGIQLFGFSDTYAEFEYYLKDENIFFENILKVSPEKWLNATFFELFVQAIQLRTQGRLGEPQDDTQNTNDGSGFDWEAIGDWVSGLFGGTCWGGSAYSAGILEDDIRKANEIFAALVASINTAIGSNNMVALGNLVADFKATAAIFEHVTNVRKLNENSWNTCTRDNILTIAQMGTVYLNQVTVALEAYIQQYFNNAGTMQTNNYTSPMVGMDNLWVGYVRPEILNAQTAYRYTPKSGVSIPRFEINEYVLTNPINQGNSSGFISTLQDVIFGGGNNNIPANTGTGNNTPTNTGGGNGSYNQPQKANTGLIAGLAILGLVAGNYYIKKRKKTA